VGQGRGGAGREGREGRAGEVACEDFKLFISTDDASVVEVGSWVRVFRSDFLYAFSVLICVIRTDDASVLEVGSWVPWR
jgi:hypothetical protein